GAAGRRGGNNLGLGLFRRETDYPAQPPLRKRLRDHIFPLQLLRVVFEPAADSLGRLARRPESVEWAVLAQAASGRPVVSGSDRADDRPSTGGRRRLRPAAAGGLDRTAIRRVGGFHLGSLAATSSAPRIRPAGLDALTRLFEDG